MGNDKEPQEGQEPERRTPNSPEGPPQFPGGFESDEGDEEQRRLFQSLWDQFAHETWEIARRYLDHHEAEDAHQACWLKILQSLKDLRDQNSARGWVCTIQRNICKDMVRRRSIKIINNAHYEDVAAREQDDGQELREAWDRALARLSQEEPDLAQVFHLCQEMTQSQAADAKQVCVRTVRYRYKRAIIMLHSYLQCEGWSEPLE